MKKTLLLIFAVVILAGYNFPQEKENNYKLINKISWLAGSYQCEKWGGIAEEYWSLPQGNNMIGMFRFMQDGAIVFTELMYITEENNTLSLKLKHFSKGLTGWEEKDKTIDFPLVELKENEAVFNGLKISNNGEGQVTVTVIIKDDTTGEAKPEAFEYKRIN